MACALFRCAAKKTHKEKNIDSRTLVNYVQQYELSPDLSLSLSRWYPLWHSRSTAILEELNAS